jgi:hypothetical protein
MIISHDRARHWAILAGTSVLPHGARVRLRRRWLANLQEQMLRRADVVFIRHPKTGGTWLRTMLTHLYAGRDGITPRRVFKSDELQRQNPDLPRYLITNGYFTWEHLVAERYAANDPMLSGKKTLFMARHPGDIVVSWHRQYQKRTKAFKRELLEAEMAEIVDWQGLDRWSFIQRPELGLPALLEYQNFWAGQLHERDDAMILRYEDLRLNTEDTLRRLVAFLDETFSDAQIRDAVAFGSVANMRTLEHQGYFQNASLKLRDADDPDTFKVRRAKVGGYREDLEPWQASWIDEQIALHSHPALGYGGAQT